MAEPREHLEHAPIVEAVIDFQVLPRDDFSPEDLRPLVDSLARQYPNVQKLQVAEANVRVSGGVPNLAFSDIGWRLEPPTSPPQAVTQLRVDGLSYSKLEPYTRWDEVFSEAQRLWAMYLAVAMPRQVTRLAVRYINRLRLPAVADLGEYLTDPPAIPEPIAGVVREFLTRIVVYDSDRDASAIIMRALEPSIGAAATVLLDIDTFCETPLPPNDASVPRIFSELRALKNEIFFASLTESAVEMYA